jgi:hypothetical protein
MKQSSWTGAPLGVVVLIILTVFILNSRPAQATFTATGTSLTGDSNSTIDVTGTLGIGNTNTTSITIGQVGQSVTFPGNLIISNGSTPGLTIGTPGSSTGQIALAGATSGTTTIQPASAASGVLILPAATGYIPYYTGTPVVGDCLQWGPGGQLTDTGSACGTGGSLAGGVYNVRDYGAKGDERFVADAGMTATQTTVSSATATFTAADTGKTLTIDAGAQGLLTATYTSGATVTGSKYQTCTVTAFNGDTGSAAGYLWLTGTNTIASSTAIDITNLGVFTSAPTSATLGSGTATCSGTITIATTLTALPITGTFTYLTATTGTLSVAATTSVTNSRMSIGTNDSTAIQSTINTACASAGPGGTVYFPAAKYLILSQLTIPNNAVGTYYSTQSPCALIGAGPAMRGYNGNDANYIANTNGTVLDLRYSGASTTGQIDSEAQGQFELANMTITDFGDDATPQVRVYAGQALIHGVMFTDNPRKFGGYGTTNKTSIVLTFGLGGVIEKNWFDRVRTGIDIINWTNGVGVRNNYWTTNGGGDWNSAALKMELMSCPGCGTPNNNTVENNSMEMTDYANGIWLSGGTQNTFLGNEFQDENGFTQNNYLFSSGTSANYVTSPALLITDLDGRNTSLSTYGGGDTLTTSSLNLIAPVVGGAYSQYMLNGNNALWGDAINHNLAVGLTQFPAVVSQTGGGANGTRNTVVGDRAGFGNTTGNNNTFIGYYAGDVVTTGYDNTFVGSLSGSGGIVTGHNNACNGYNSCSALTSGNFNTADGSGAGAAISSGQYVTAYGFNAGNAEASNGNGSFFGANSCKNATGGLNGCFGYGIGNTLTTGTGNLLLGSANGVNTVDVPAAGTNYYLNIANLIVGDYQKGKLIFEGPTSALNTDCGTTPTLVGGSNDMTGQVTVGTTSSNSCKVTFSSARVAAPFCVVSPQTLVAGFGYSVSTTALTVTSSGTLDGIVFDYFCPRGATAANPAP